MAAIKPGELQQDIPCCPPLEADNVCDVLDFHYRQIHSAVVGAADRRQNVSVEVIIRVRMERCPGPLVLGDLVYSTTLLPGEKVKLFTSDRRTRFTFDSESKVSYRNEQTQEEHFYMASMSDFMSDITVKDASRATNTSKGSAKGHAETSGAIQSFFGGASVDVSGSYDASSTSTFLRELSQHAQSSSRRAEMGTRAASAVSIGEVQTRSHTEGESQDHFESSSREFSNPNRCHAITFFFYRINKKQTLKVMLVSVERRVIDPAVNTRITNNQFVSRGDISTIPAGVLATNKERVDIEDIGRASVLAQRQAESGVRGQASASAAFGFETGAFTGASGFNLPPISLALRQQALLQVDRDLVSAGILDKEGGVVTEETKTQFSFEQVSSLPTGGVLVKGCLDDCDICEPELQQQHALELEHLKLQNDLLKRQIELLDKSQEYRCCPKGEEEPVPEG
jgi:hypothetical protein